MNLNQFLDSLPVAPAADEQPKLAAERNAPHRRGLRTQAADGTLLGYDSMPLGEALPDSETERAERSSAPICFDTVAPSRAVAGAATPSPECSVRMASRGRQAASKR